MKYAIAFGLSLAALLFVAGSMAMNWSFWHGQGVDAGVGHILGALSIAVDLFKAFLPVAIDWARVHRAWLAWTIGSIFFAACLVFSLVSAIGFASMVRDAATADREGLGLQYRRLADEALTIRERLAALSHVRPATVLEELVAKARQDRRWDTSDACRNATLEATRVYCRAIGDLRAELAASREAEAIRGRMHEIEAGLDRLERAGARRNPDGQAAMLRRVTGWLPERVDLSLALLFAVVVEAGAAFGFFLALMPLGGAKGLQAAAPVPVRRQSGRLRLSTPPPKRLEGPRRLRRRDDGGFLID